VLGALSAARADEKPQTREAAAEEATKPLLTVNSLQLQPAYINVHAGGNDGQLLIRLDQVYQWFLIPGIKLWDMYTFARLEMYGETVNSPGAPSVTGLQNWNALLLPLKGWSWGAQAGVGVNAVLPTSTDATLDTQEFQLGPALGAAINHVRHLQLGLLVQFLFSVAGTTPDLGYVNVQPIIVYHLPNAFFLKTDGIMKFDFENSPHATIPVNVHVGLAATTQLALSAIVEGVTTGSGQGNVTVKLNVNYFAW
jgi:hypothetical protein